MFFQFTSAVLIYIWKTFYFLCSHSFLSGKILHEEFNANNEVASYISLSLRVYLLKIFLFIRQIKKVELSTILM